MNFVLVKLYLRQWFLCNLSAVRCYICKGQRYEEVQGLFDIMYFFLLMEKKLSYSLILINHGGHNSACHHSPGILLPAKPLCLQKKNSKGLISALERYDSPLYEIAIIPKIPDINVCQIGG